MITALMTFGRAVVIIFISNGIGFFLDNLNSLIIVVFIVDLLHDKNIYGVLGSGTHTLISQWIVINKGLY